MPEPPLYAIASIKSDAVHRQPYADNIFSSVSVPQATIGISTTAPSCANVGNDAAASFVLEGVRTADLRPIAPQGSIRDRARRLPQPLHDRSATGRSRS